MANYMKPKKRSLVASVISFIGSLVFVYGLYHILSAIYKIVTTDEKAVGKIILGILLVILCFAIQYASFAYDKSRENIKWKKRLESAGITEELSENEELCWQAYRSNPTAFGLRYIEEHNPKAAADITAYLEETSGKGFTNNAPAVKIKEKKDPQPAIETQQDWENGETIIR